MTQEQKEQQVFVVGVDFSPANRPAVDAAIAMAKDNHARLALVHALQPLGASGLAPAWPRADHERNETSDIVSNVGDPIHRWERRVREAGIEVEAISRSGNAVQVIVEEVQRMQADGIVVGTHGKTGIKKAILGSTAEGVVTQSPVPVLVVPADRSEPQHVVLPVGPKV